MSNEFVYRETRWSWKAIVYSGVACDSQDRVYVIRRTHLPAILVFDREGNFLRSFAEDLFVVPHGIWISPEDNLYCTDIGNHTVTKLSLDGEVLMTLGTKGKKGKLGEPFNRPTRAVESPSGDIFISDGYGQQRVHKFSPDGHLIHSWGSRGRGPGQFALPHSIWVDREERIYVADRTNCRIGIFNSEGDFLDQWIEFAYPNEIYMDKNNTIYVAESGLGTGEPEFADAGRISILNAKGEVQGRFQSRMAHGMWVDSKGDIYVTHLVLGITKYAKKKV
ncbi:6-bladed beta-propeller [Candidatus Bathyarchaeota archaeon]|nr:6-bladed beta-propeller [Candidatus Bathyarchaeota archaeon]